MAQFQQSGRQAQRRVLSDYIYLHRENPAVRPYFQWQESGAVYTDRFRPEDENRLLAMVATHEGAEAAQLAQHWLRRQPKGVSVFRAAANESQGFLAMVALDKTTPADRAQDPAARATWDYLQRHAPLRPGETATLFRFWMAGDVYQAISPVQSRIFLNMVQHYLTAPGLAYTFLPFANPDFWTGIAAYADLTRLETADFEVGGRRYGVYGHDWRAVPPLAWLALMAEREVGATSTPPSRPVEALVVLSESDFATAIREALRRFTDANALNENSLLRSQLVVNRAGSEADLSVQVAALRDLLRETAVTFQRNPRQVKFYRALHHTYFQPAATQEQAAELLDLPFSTYRRHLRAGIAAVTEQLWQQELGVK